MQVQRHRGSDTLWICSALAGRSKTCTRLYIAFHFLHTTSYLRASYDGDIGGGKAPIRKELNHHAERRLHRTNH